MKEAYIIKHTHAESNPNLAGGVKPTTLQILNIAYALAMDFGLRCRPNSLFSDGYDEQLVAQAEQYLRDARQYEGSIGPFLKMGMKDMLRQGHLGEFQYLWSMLLYGSLQDAGIEITLKPTDISFREFRTKIGPALFQQWCRETGTDPSSVTAQQFRDVIQPRETKYRDNYIHRKIKELGTDRNLLLIGAAHPLESLIADPEFTTYVVEVDYQEGQTFTISGTLPEKLLNNKDALVERIQQNEHDLSPFLGLGYVPKIEANVEIKEKPSTEEMCGRKKSSTR